MELNKPDQGEHMSSLNRMPGKQRGMTFISWLFVLAIGIFFILIAIKMVPTYLENFAIKEVLATVEQDRGSRELSGMRLKDNVLKRFKINGVYDFPRDKIKIEKSKRGRQILINYEVRKPVVGNVFIVMSFSDTAVIPQ